MSCQGSSSLSNPTKEDDAIQFVLLQKSPVALKVAASGVAPRSWHAALHEGEQEAPHMATSATNPVCELLVRSCYCSISATMATLAYIMWCPILKCGGSPACCSIKREPRSTQIHHSRPVYSHSHLESVVPIWLLLLLKPTAIKMALIRRKP